jgi:hypothetical protein
MQRADFATSFEAQNQRGYREDGGLELRKVSRRFIGEAVESVLGN